MAFRTMSLFPRSSSGAYFNLPWFLTQAASLPPSTTGRRFGAAGSLHVQMKFLQFRNWTKNQWSSKALPKLTGLEAIKIPKNVSLRSQHSFLPFLPSPLGNQRFPNALLRQQRGCPPAVQPCRYATDKMAGNQLGPVLARIIFYLPTKNLMATGSTGRTVETFPKIPQKLPTEICFNHFTGDFKGARKTLTIRHTPKAPLVEFALALHCRHHVETVHFRFQAPHTKGALVNLAVGASRRKPRLIMNSAT